MNHYNNILIILLFFNIRIYRTQYSYRTVRYEFRMGSDDPTLLPLLFDFWNGAVFVYKWGTAGRGGGGGGGGGDGSPNLRATLFLFFLLPRSPLNLVYITLAHQTPANMGAE